jgi:hypothetical protein
MNGCAREMAFRRPLPGGLQHHRGVSTGVMMPGVGKDDQPVDHASWNSMPPHAPSYCINNAGLCLLYLVYPLQKVDERACWRARW